MARYTNSVPDIYDKNGLPIVGAKKFFFKPGTTIIKTVYKDSEFLIPQTNPILSDSAGRFPDMFLDGVYKEVQQDNSGTQTGFDGITLWTREPVGAAAIGGEFQPWNNLITYNLTSIVVGSDGNYYKSKIAPNLNNDPISSPEAWTELKFGEVWDSVTSYFTGDTVFANNGFSYLAKSDNIGKEPSISSEWGANTEGDQFADAGGTSDAITANFNPPIAALKDGLRVNVRAAYDNTTQSPTFSPNGLTAKIIRKYGNKTVEPSDINSANHILMLTYNLTNDVWELLNPVIPADTVLGISYSSISSILSTASPIPYDSSAPQSTEGMQILSRSYTVKEVATNIYVEVNCNISGAAGSGAFFTAALFDGNISAVAANAAFRGSGSAASIVSFNYQGTYPKGTAVTFTVRVGKDIAGNTYINSHDGAARLGGTLSCNIKVTEVK